MAKLDPIVEFREDHRKVRDGLNILAERFSTEKLDKLGEHFAQSRAEGVPLLRWENTIRKGQHSN